MCRWRRDLEEMRQKHLEAERLKNSHLCMLTTAAEEKEEDHDAPRLVLGGKGRPVAEDAGAGCSVSQAYDGDEESGGDDDGGSVYSDLSRDSDDPVSLVEIQERARAAQRAAVLMLLPRPLLSQDAAAEEAAAAMEGGAARKGPESPASWTVGGEGGGGPGREAAVDCEEVAELLHKVRTRPALM